MNNLSANKICAMAHGRKYDLDGRAFKRLLFKQHKTGHSLTAVAVGHSSIATLQPAANYTQNKVLCVRNLNHVHKR